jgi:hypothetical protein
MVDDDRNLRHLPLLQRRSSSSAAWGMDGVQRKGLDRSIGFYTSAVDSVLVVSSVGDWAAGRCILDGIESCVHGCDRLGRWGNIAVEGEPFSVRVHG